MRKRLLALGTILLASVAPSFAADAPVDPALMVPKSGIRKTQPGMVHSITHKGNLTEIVIHDKPHARRLRPSQSRNYEEVSVQAPGLQPVRYGPQPGSMPAPPGYGPQTAYAPQGPWTQDYEPGQQAGAYQDGYLPTPYYYGPGAYGYGNGYGGGYRGYSSGYYAGGGYGPYYPGYSYSHGNRQTYHSTTRAATSHGHSGSHHSQHR